MKHGSLYHLDPSVKDRTVPSRYLSRQIGKYRVIRFLGGGAFAWVYEAVDRDLEIPVALKILRPEFAGQEDAELRFRREATMAARLRHPNIVTVRDVGQVDGASFVAMDLLPLSLARRLELLPRLPEADVVRIGLDVAAALAIAHAGGIVHRDIKPDNILIGPQGESVVADFGLARALQGGAALSGSNQVMGTPHYFSPEQARGLELDGRTDLYALGVTLFRTATGRLPFEGDDWYEVARMHVDNAPPSVRDFVPELSPEFDALIARLLKKSPDERFANALELADAMAALPTAPAPRVLTTMRSGASETITAYQSVVTSAPTRSKSSHLVRQFTVVAGVIAAVAWVATQSTFVQQLLSAAPRVASSDSARDSAASVVPDTTAQDTVTNDTLPSTAPVASTPKVPNGDSIRKLAAEKVKTRLILSAPDEANLYVDNVMQGRGSITIERSRAAQLSLRAALPGAPAECTTASRDSIVRLNVGEQKLITLKVRTCFGVQFSVNQPDATVRFTSVEDSSTVEIKADSIRSVLLPEGHYRVKASAPRCVDYNDDWPVNRSAPLTRSIRLIC